MNFIKRNLDLIILLIITVVSISVILFFHFKIKKEAAGHETKLEELKKRFTQISKQDFEISKTNVEMATKNYDAVKKGYDTLLKNLQDNYAVKVSQDAELEDPTTAQDIINNMYNSLIEMTSDKITYSSDNQFTFQGFFGLPKVEEIPDIIKQLQITIDIVEKCMESGIKVISEINRPNRLARGDDYLCKTTNYVLKCQGSTKDVKKLLNTFITSKKYFYMVRLVSFEAIDQVSDSGNILLPRFDGAEAVNENSPEFQNNLIPQKLINYNISISSVMNKIKT